MESELLTTEPGAEVVAAQLRGLVAAAEEVSAAVAEILAGVRSGGDVALARLTERFDTAGHPAPALRVNEAELAAAEAGLEGAVRRALSAALENVHQVAAAGIPESPRRISDRAREVILREEPVQRAAVYVPAGRAPYPSTLVMGVAAARAAGVREIVLCSPPRGEQGVDPVILGAARLVGVGEVYRMGGAQAIAALAYGTETVRPVDVIVGPGNVYVQEAKRQLSTQVGIDGFAGPSDLMVVVEEEGRALEWVALDLLAQAEHGTGTIVVAVSTSRAVIDSLSQRLRNAPHSDAVLRLVHARTIGDALELVQRFAPEHLQLVGAGAEGLAPHVTRAGCVFVGAGAGTAFGDYIAGSNHILPTNGSARFASGLSAAQFRRRFTEVRILDPAELARVAAPLARAEGFELHARSMEVRIGDNRSQ